MKRTSKLLLCLFLTALTLSACTANPPPTSPFPEVTQYLGPTPTPTAVPQNNGAPADGGASDSSIFANNPYEMGDGFTPEDALGEEDYVDDGTVGGEPNDLLSAAVDPNATAYPFAGSTPIPLDPVDMPSPTPRAPLSFTYVPYTISTLGLTFEGPAGWIPDESQNEIFTLTEPEQQMKDGQLGVITISATPVNSTLSESNLKTEVTQRLNNISATNFAEWHPSLTATRHLMGSVGVYANYSGKMVNGLEIGGRIHCVSIDNKLYSIEIMFPQGFKDDFLEVFSKMRSTIKRQ